MRVEMGPGGKSKHAQPGMPDRRVLWVSHFIPWPLTGGASLRSFNLLGEAAKGFDVRFVGFVRHFDLAKPDLVDEARSALLRHCSGVRFVELRREHRWMWQQRIVLQSLISRTYDEVWLWDRAMREALEQEREAFRPDLVHFDTIGLAQYADRFSGLPLVLNHHNVESHMMRRRVETERNVAKRAVLQLQARRLERLERQAARQFVQHLTCSSLDRERLERIAPGLRVAVVPNGVDIDYFAYREPSESVAARLIFVGSMDYYPNREAALWFLDTIWPLVRARHADATFSLVGRCESPDIRARAAAPGITIAGSVPDVRDYVAESAVFVCPIRQGGGTRLKLLDAMALGIPLVTTSMSAEGLDIVPGRHALIADDPDSFARAISELLEDPARRRQLASEGRRLVESRYAWPLIGGGLRAAYEQALGSRQTIDPASRAEDRAPLDRR